MYGYFSLLLHPVIKNIETSLTNIVTYRGELYNESLNKVVAESNKKKLEELKTKLGNTIITLPESERNPEIAYNLKKIGDINGIKINAVNFSQSDVSNPQQGGNGTINGADASANLIPVPVSLQVSGEYNNIINFISAIENDKRIAEVSSVSMSNASDTLAATININYIYMQVLNKDNEQYDFNKDTYGKKDLFK